MRVAFFGTPAPATVALDALLASTHEVVAAVTRPDRPRGRSGAPLPSPVKERALAAGLELLQPDGPRDPGFAKRLASCAPAACAVVAYGHILPTDVLAVPPKGTVNVHFSLLPRYRGAAPVQRAIMAGERQTGVTTFLLEPTLDTGPVLLQVPEPISPDDTAGTLTERLAPVGARLLVETLDGLEAGSLAPRPQDAALATPAPKVSPDEGALDWTLPAANLVNLIRGLNPAPGAFTSFRGRRVKLWLARLAPEAAAEPGASPGRILFLGKERFAVACGEGALEPLELQPEGGRRMSAAEFARGRRPSPDDRFDRG